MIKFRHETTRHPWDLVGHFSKNGSEFAPKSDEETGPNPQIIPRPTRAEFENHPLHLTSTANLAPSNPAPSHNPPSHLSDKFTLRLKDAFKNDSFKKGTGVMRYRLDKPGYIRVLTSLGLTDRMTSVVNQQLVWSDVLVERLKGGRGSAIKGQTRGRGMEDFVENIVRSVFGPDQVAVRGSFLGAKGQGSAKADFAIPSMEDPSILIETKAYGATGSKQSDVLGDVAKILEEKRHDTDFLLITDGVTWKERANDLRRLIKLQNEGKILRIYTKSMAVQLTSDLRSLKRSHRL